MRVFVTGGSGLTGPAIVAELIAALAIPAVSLTPVSSDRTRTLLGWTPTHPTLLGDIEAGHYCATRAL